MMVTSSCFLPPVASLLVTSQSRRFLPAARRSLLGSDESMEPEASTTMAILRSPLLDSALRPTHCGVDARGTRWALERPARAIRVKKRIVKFDSAVVLVQDRGYLSRAAAQGTSAHIMSSAGPKTE